MDHIKRETLCFFLPWGQPFSIVNFCTSSNGAEEFVIVIVIVIVTLYQR